MKYTLLNILNCPKCTGRFNICGLVNEQHNELFEGTLQCQECQMTYPIINYIPRLVDQQNYSASWGKLWQETGEILRDSFTKTPFHYNVIHGKYSENGHWSSGTSPFGFEWPLDMTGENILEIGPGTGNCTEHLVKTGANVVCIDMSNAIDTLPEELLIQPNINIIQADMNTPVIEQEYFDRIWLFQVLQHTPSPVETLRVIRDFLKPGGELAFTSYYGQYNPWYYRFTKRIDDEIAWKLIAFLVPKLAPVKYCIQKANITLLSNVLTKAMHPIDPRNIYYTTLEGKANQYIHGKLWQQTQDQDLLMKYVIINTFDRITPEYTNSANHNTIEAWTLASGFSSVKTWGKGGVRAKATK